MTERSAAKLYHGAGMAETDDPELIACLASAITGAPTRPSAADAARWLRTATHHGVHLVLADGLAGHAQAHWPSTFTSELGVLTGAAVLVEAVVHDECVRVFSALEKRGVHPIVFKGGALAHTIYRRPYLRPRTDTDILIAKPDLPAIEETFAALRYTRPVETSGALVTHQCHFEKREGPGVLHAWDVHWKISNAQAVADALTYEEISRDAVPIPALGGVAAPSNVNALLLACLHRVAHHADAPDLLWLLDIHLLALRMSPHDWQHVIALARARAVWSACARSLARSADIFRTTIPRFVADALAEPIDDRASQLLAPGLRQIDILRADLAALPTWSARWRLVREHVFPPAAFMAARYGMQNRAALPLWYMRRIFEGGPEWFRRRGE
jgi:hypothetical protein